MGLRFESRYFWDQVEGMGPGCRPEPQIVVRVLGWRSGFGRESFAWREVSFWV